MFVDSHCHLSFPELAANLPQIRQAMADAQVDRALCICTTLEEFEDVHALAMQYDNFWASAGVNGRSTLSTRCETQPRLVMIRDVSLRPSSMCENQSWVMNWIQ